MNVLIEIGITILIIICSSLGGDIWSTWVCKNKDYYDNTRTKYDLVCRWMITILLYFVVDLIRLK